MTDLNKVFEELNKLYEDDRYSNTTDDTNKPAKVFQKWVSQIEATILKSGMLIMRNINPIIFGFDPSYTVIVKELNLSKKDLLVLLDLLEGIRNPTNTEATISNIAYFLNKYLIDPNENPGTSIDIRKFIDWIKDNYKKYIIDIFRKDIEAAIKKTKDMNEPITDCKKYMNKIWDDSEFTIEPVIKYKNKYNK